MKFLLFLSSLISTFFIYGQCITPSSTIVTAYATNNGQRGAMFDLTATNPVTVICFDANLYTGTTSTYEVYYKVGSFIGSESNAAAWTFVGSASGVTSLGTNVPTPIPIMVNINIPAGQTYGFYVTNTSGGGLSYTDGPANNTILASDANLTLRGGVGKSYPFGLNFNYRNINATVHYQTYTPLPVGMTDFTATASDKEVFLKWETASEQNNDYFTLERSQDMEIWESIGTVKGSGNSSTPVKYEFVDRQPLSGYSYYRLSQTDFDGTREYLGVQAARVIEKVSDALTATPNPTAGSVEFQLSPDEMGDILISDLLGRNLTSEAEISYENGILKIGLERIHSGALVIRCGDRSTIVVKQ